MRFLPIYPSIYIIQYTTRQLLFSVYKLAACIWIWAKHILLARNRNILFTVPNKLLIPGKSIKKANENIEGSLKFRKSVNDHFFLQHYSGGHRWIWDIAGWIWIWESGTTRRHWCSFPTCLCRLEHINKLTNIPKWTKCHAFLSHL